MIPGIIASVRRGLVETLNIPLISDLVETVVGATPTFVRATVATETDHAADVAVDAVASGTAQFDGTLGVRIETASENELTATEDFSGWTQTGACVITANDTTSPRGDTTASKIVGMGNSSSNQCYFSAVSITAAENDPIAFSFYIKKISTTGDLRIYSAYTPTDGEWQLELDSLGSGWERITEDHPSVTVTTAWTTSSSGPGNMGVIVRSQADDAREVYMWGMSAEDNGYSTSYMLGTTPRNKSELEYAITPDTNDISITCDWTPQEDSGATHWLLSSYSDASNYIALLYDGTDVIFRKRISGTNYDATKTTNITTGTTYAIKGVLDSADGVDVYVDDVKGTTNSNTTNAVVGTTIEIGADGNGSGQVTCNIKNVVGTGIYIMPADYYLSPTGSDSNSGTYASPFKTLDKLWTVIGANDLAYMRGGTYLIDDEQSLTGVDGTAGNLIKVWAYPGETPVISPSGSYSRTGTSKAINVGGDYIHLKGIEITGFEQITSEVWTYGLFISNSENCLFELINQHHNGFGVIANGTCDNNTFLNCDFHNNSDPLSADAYGGADGITIRVHTQAATHTLSGCRMWNNSDDGIDLWDNEGLVVIENCWSFWNGFRPDSFTDAGDGVGFKLGQTDNNTGLLKRQLSNLLSFQNRGWGIDENGYEGDGEIFNCTMYDNGYLQTGGFRGGIVLDHASGAFDVKNNISYDNEDDDVDITDTTDVDHNDWDTSVTITDADFESVSTTGVNGARQSDGSLPSLDFLKLAAGSDAIDAGVDVGLDYSGSAPDLGAYET